MLGSLALLATLLLTAADVQPGEPELPFVVVVHRSNPDSSISRAELSAVFMRRTRRWPDGTEITPIDRPPRSPLREQFSAHVHRKSVAYVIRYWHRAIFSGRDVPPEEARSDEAVLEIVAGREGAIGYIERGTVPGDDVKVIAVTP